jgi:hypothetical protein
MAIDQLIEAATEARDELGGDAEIRVAYQQNYPLRGTLQTVTVPESKDADYLYGEDGRASGQDEDGGFWWLAVGPVEYGENPYGPEWAWNGVSAW